MPNQNVQPFSNINATPPVKPKKTNLKLSIILSVVISFLYGIAVEIYATLEGGAAMSSGQIPLFLALPVLGFPIGLLVLHFILLKKFLPYRNRFLVLWAITSLVIGFLLFLPLSILTLKIAEIRATPIINRMYAPSKDASQFHPRVTLLSFTPQKNSSSSIDRVDIKIEVTASREGEVELVAGLYSDTKSFPRITDSKTFTISTNPTLLTFVLKPSENENFSIFGIYAYFKPSKEAYSSEAIISDIPIVDFKDSGLSKFEKIPTEDDRTAFYKIILRPDVPSPTIGFGQILDENFKYGFSYPGSTRISCKLDTLFPCGSNSDLNLEVWPLDSSYFIQSDIKAGLLEKNLFCNDYSSERNQWCKNTKVEEYTNSLGTKGFKVYRTITIKNGKPENYNDHVYVFPLSKTVYSANSAAQNSIKYSGILLSTSMANLPTLDSIADTYFNY